MDHRPSLLRSVLVTLAVLGVAVAAFLAQRPSDASTATTWSAVAPGPLDEDDGVVPDEADVSVFDEELPAVSGLDPALLDALQRAATDATTAGVEFRVNSGWRSPRYQQRLLQEAVVEHGSLEEAERWVATPETSAHVSGDAVDVGPAGAAAWLSEHGAPYGLCRTYGNEPWHYELHPDAPVDGCPPPYADPTDDPRLQP
jgi:hypothetical protein